MGHPVVSVCVAMSQDDIRFRTTRILRAMPSVRLQRVFSDPFDEQAAHAAFCPCRYLILGRVEYESICRDRHIAARYGEKCLLVVLEDHTPLDVLRRIANHLTAALAISRLEQELPIALLTVAADMRVMSGRFRQNASADQLASLETHPQTPTSREREILTLIASGFSNQEIAARLGLSVKTVESYKHRLKLRFDLHSRHDYFVLAEQLHLTAR